MLFEMINNPQRVLEISKKADAKEINPKWISVFFNSQIRNLVFERMCDGKYKIFPPHIALIPKEKKGEFRQVYVNEDLDRIMLMIINDCLFELFHDMIHPCCVSYQKGIGSQMVVKRISNHMTKIEKKSKPNSKNKNRIGVKMDFSKYFDNVSIECIDEIFEKMKSRLPIQDHPIIDYLIKYYHQDLYFDLDGKLQSQYQGLKQGCAVASFLACVIPYEYDEYMSKKYKVYYRYSDDVLVLDDDNEDVEEETRRLMGAYGVSLNPEKVESVYIDSWVKFLGFELKGHRVTLSQNRFDKFEKMILDLTSNKSKKKAFKDVIYWMYVGEHCWATSCLSTINCEKDIAEMEKFVKDAINSSEVRFRKLGRLHTNLTGKEGILFRAKGKGVRKNREWIPNYHSMFEMRNNLIYSRELFEARGREMMRREFV